jgi:2-haloacid dehalogenase
MSAINTRRPAVIFDFGGVLMDWNPRYLYSKLFNGDEAAMERFFSDISFVQWNTEQDRGRPFAVAVAELCERFPHYTPYIHAYHERWEEFFSGPIQASVDILHELKNAGYPLHGLSNWSAEKFPLVREKYKFFGCFDSILLSGEVGLVKPDPRVYTLLLERTGLTANECVFIDDTAVNIEAANTLGFTAIHFRSSAQLCQDLRGLGLLT